MEDKKARCPSCEERFTLEDNLRTGDSTYCPSCYANLRIVKLDPPEVEETEVPFDDYDEDDEDNER